mmetsp:Transcript_15986/g.42229  ORF Transcript_15986/g.42229 Transcript_15986/m.42229 type:complete len:235 (+) Transcript_15986:691-1395(+)
MQPQSHVVCLLLMHVSEVRHGLDELLVPALRKDLQKLFHAKCHLVLLVLHLFHGQAHLHQPLLRPLSACRALGQFAVFPTEPHNLQHAQSPLAAAMVRKISYRAEAEEQGAAKPGEPSVPPLGMVAHLHGVHHLGPDCAKEHCHFLHVVRPVLVGACFLGCLKLVLDRGEQVPVGVREAEQHLGVGELLRGFLVTMQEARDGADGEAWLFVAPLCDALCVAELELLSFLHLRRV